MKWKSLLLISALTTSACFTGSISVLAAEHGSYAFTVSQPTMVPGLALKPGGYSIHILDHLQDRFVLRIEGPGGSPHTLLIGVPSSAVTRSGGPGPVNWDAAPDNKAAMRGFVFPGDNGAVQFVYPKDDAVALAKLNHEKILAVDPASEGRSPHLSDLTNDEIQMVTLWTLTPTAVGPEPGAEVKIAAAKYQSDNQQVASAAQPAQPTPPTPAMKKMKTLPHTASNLPLISLIGLLAACGGSLLFIRRFAANAAHEPQNG
jgi:LPXTG-motif cell wall-anchored protein